jgi:asparagine synthase (glutamine-hydrolysing)
VFAAAKQAGIKVMLDGQGADEMVGGYRHHIGARIVSLLRKGEIKAAMALLAHAAQLPAGGGLIRTLSRVIAGFAPALSGDLMQRRRSARSALDHEWFVERGAACGMLYGQGRTSLRESLAHDFTQASLPALLRYEDRNSMAHSIESRVPLLTRSIVDFVFSLPEGFLIGSDGTGKTVLRAALRGLVPDAVLDRPDKIGFQTPERSWLRHLDGWVSGVIAGEVARSVPFLRVDAVIAEWEAVREGRHSFDWRIWRWLNLIRWSECMQARFG